MIAPGRSGCRRSWLGLILGLGLAGLGSPGWAAEVARFSPEGLVRGIRQVEARFSAPMVPLGDPAGAPDPFDIACDAGGTGRDVLGPGRWVDSRSWALDLGGDLPAGIRCVFRVRPGLADLEGRPAGGRREFAFSTGGPAIRAAYPAAGAEDVDEEQAFVLDLDGQAAPASIVLHAHFAVEGLADRVGVRLLDGRAKAVVLAARYGPGRERWPPHAVVLQARQRFPSRARVRLVWGAGIATPGGLATDADQSLAFRVRAAFTATFRCERENPRAGCVPVSPLRLELSADVPWSLARRITLVGPDGARWLPRREGEGGEDDGGRAAGPERPEAPDPDGGRAVRRVVFRPPFPESTTFRVEVPPGLRDDAGRPLQNASAFPLRVRTEAYPPLAKFPARFGVVERADPVLPVTVRSLEPDLRMRLLRVDQAPGAARGGLGPWVRSRILRIPPPHADDILPWLRKVGSADRETSIFEPAPGPVPADAPRLLDLPRPDGPAGFQVVGIPLGEPGLYVLELESRRLGAALLGRPGRPMYVPAAALVTNLAVHLKWGREASLAWVTALDSGRPVGRARVTVYDCRGTRRARAESDRDGIARLGALPRPDALPRCPLPYARRPFFDHAQTAALGSLDEGLLVVAQTVEDLGFVHSSWSQGIEPWRFQLPDESELAPVVAHTILDRPLFRAGETVHMKHLVRAHGLAGFSAVPAGERPTRLSIRHQGSDERHDLAITWTAGGVAVSTWPIPREARLGRYELVLVRPAPAPGSPGSAPPTEPGADPPGDREWTSGAFRVEEFRVPLLRGLVQPPAEPQVAAGAFPVDLAVQYLAGGPAASQPVTVRVQLRPRGVAPGEGPGEALEGFAVANGPVREGLERRSRGLDTESDEEDGEPEADAATPAIHQRETLTLDATGTGRVTVRDLPRAPTPREALVELEFRDPSGEAQTVAATVPLWPAARLAAIRPDGWVASRERLRVVAAAIDVEGRPVSGSLVRVTAFQARSYSHRKRLVGGVYGWEHVRETRRLAEVCAGMTDSGGRLVCEGPAPADGQVLLEARTADGEGRESAAHASVWVAGSEAWWFEAREHDRMDVLPERPRYEPGETARLQVRMPFREATALVTMEREGVLDAFVTTLSGQAPVVEVPVRPVFAPNMFLSILAVRGRVGDVQPTALVDLGRPAFKLGVAEIRVGTGAHRLDVSVEPERTSYRVRDRVRVRLAVRAPGGGPPPPGSEVAVAAVDEGLLELAGNPSWALLEAMLGRRGHAVQTATAALQVVGRRHYGKKAVPSGGGGGRQTTRELFDTLLLWQPRVALDARGDATVEVPLGDALTGVRIVAVATGGTVGGTGGGEDGPGLGLFGTGRASVRVTQDLMVLPGLPPVVRDGDRFRAEVTLRNTTASPLTVEVSAVAAGLPGVRPAQTLALAGGEARVVGWDVVAPAGVEGLAWDFQATATGSAGTPGPTDRVRALQKVVPVTPVRTQQATLARTGASAALREPVARPARALPERGGVEVALRPTLVGGLEGVREWMRRYPYTCMEQRTSRAVALRDAGLWRDVVRSLPAHLDDDGLLRYFPGPGPGSDVLTAYVLAVTHEAGWDLPEDARDRMLEALVKFVEGGLLRPGALPAADLSLRRLTALEALSRFGKAEPKHVAALAIEPTLWPTSALLDWRSLLVRVPAIPRQAERLREAERILRARLDLSGTALAFSTESRDGLYWLMISADANAVRLLLHAVETGLWPDDVGRLVRGALGRQRQGAWDTTVANAWGILAVERFSRAFEATPVDGVTGASLARPDGDPRPAQRQTLDWGSAAGGGVLRFPWPAGSGDLIVEHAGRGEPWVTLTARAAVPLEAPRAAGYRLTRQVEPVETRVTGWVSRGDVVRVRLTVEADADMTWVVVEDPVPAGASHLGTGLRRDSAILASGERSRGAWPAFEERGFEAYRAYFERLPRGTTVVEYTVRLGQAGAFHLPPTRVEALYAPERFGEWPNAVVMVEP